MLRVHVPQGDGIQWSVLHVLSILISFKSTTTTLKTRRISQPQKRSKSNNTFQLWNWFEMNYSTLYNQIGRDDKRPLSYYKLVNEQCCKIFYFLPNGLNYAYGICKFWNHLVFEVKKAFFNHRLMSIGNNCIYRVDTFHGFLTVYALQYKLKVKLSSP